MASDQIYQHTLGAAWTDQEVAELVRGLSERGELDAIDAIAWLRLELARVRTGLPIDGTSARRQRLPTENVR